jgi:hypothetical protein
MIAAAVVVVDLVHLVLGLAFAQGARPHPITEAVFAFIALYFLLLGLRMIAGFINDPEILLGATSSHHSLSLSSGRCERNSRQRKGRNP